MAVTEVGAPGSNRASSGTYDLSSSVLDEDQIIGVLIAAHTGEVQEADLALGVAEGEEGAPGADAAIDSGVARFSNPAVGDLAQGLIADAARWRTAVEQLGIAARSSSASTEWADTVGGTLSTLTPLSGGAFDVAYVQAQAADLTRARDLVEGGLAAASLTAQVRDYLLNTQRPAIESRLATVSALVKQLTDECSVEAGVDTSSD